MKKVLFNTLMFLQIIICATMFVSCSCSDDSAKSKEWEAEMQTAIGKGDFTEARACAAKAGGWSGHYKIITRAQIAFLINSGSLDQAFSLSQEEGMVYVYFELFMPKLIDVYESKGKTEVLKNLALVQFEHVPDFDDDYISSSNDNGKYNTEATRYNTLLEQFITYIDISGDREFALQLLRFVKPLVVESPVKKDGTRDNVKLSEQPLADIKKKLNIK